MGIARPNVNEIIESLTDWLNVELLKVQKRVMKALNKNGYSLEYEHCYEIQKLIEEVLGKVSEIPTGWILCSDRLPTEVMLCWATIEEKQTRFVRKLRYYPMCDTWVHDNGQGISEHAKVIAWMEYNIPAPYEEGE